MENNKNIIITFILTQIVIGLVSCSENQTETVDPPNIWEPSNFRVIDYEAVWSPNGDKIAYVHGDTLEGLTGIYLIDINGSNKRLLLSDPSASTPAWAPDGNWIVFEMYAQIWKIKETGDSLTQLTFEGRNFFPSVSPNGDWITFDSNIDYPNGMNFIWKMKVDGTHKTRIAYAVEVGEVRNPHCASNNKIIHIRYAQDFLSTEIFAMDSSGQNLERITFNNNTDDYPHYSLNQNKIVFTSQAMGEYPQIWIVNMDGSNPQQLTKTQGYTCDWSLDGKKLFIQIQEPKTGCFGL